MSSPGIWFHFHLTMLVIIFHSKTSVSQPRATEAALVCSNRTAPNSDRQIIYENFLAAMDAITAEVSWKHYGAVSNGTGSSNAIYAYGECMRDLSPTDCNLCFVKSKTEILRCSPFQGLIRGGRLFYDGCYLRYDDYMFFKESLSPEDTSVCGSDDFVGSRTLFGASVAELLRNSRIEGVRNDGFFAGFVDKGNLTVYGLAQCWRLVDGRGCGECLENAALRIGACPPKVEGRALNAGCYMRYSTTKFYNDSGSEEAPSGGKSRRLATIVASTCGAAACLLFAAMISLFVRKRIVRKQREKKQLGPLLSVINRSKINFSYETLERATNYFSDSNRLGQGGSGSVYKGILPSGQTVAVKRLFFNTTQWADHIFNEVNLISDINHINLVKLLGCSVTGPESLLVYEYVPNRSLRHYLFDRKDVRRLGWEERYKIVLGTAEGLAFLHENTKLRIIHRDIKLSNVLLDEDFNPKIADFGLARMFPQDMTHISTAVAGTLGYVAPEYILHGKLTEKADVYSFGVVLIEVISGTRNNAFSQHSNSIFKKVWDLNNSGKLLEAVDPSLKGTFPEEAVIRAFQIGLICVQAAAELRPSMSTVVKLLSGNLEIPRPTQPPFLNLSGGEGMGSHTKADSCTISSGNEII